MSIPALSGNQTASGLLATYPAFRFRQLLRTSSSDKRFLQLNSALTLFSFLCLLIAASVDDTLFLAGRAVGFFEHPAIFGYLLAQGLIPRGAADSLQLVAHLPGWGGSLLSANFITNDAPALTGKFHRFVALDTNLSRFTYTLLTCGGMVVVIWNTYANQQPFVFAGFDFWDSAQHLWGFALTRVYKFYMWVLFFPALVHFEIGVLLFVRRLLLVASAKKQVRLSPFDADESGGAANFIDAVVKPLRLPLLVAGFMVAATVFIHRKVDVMTAGATLVFALLFFLLYLLPASALHDALSREKREQMGKLSTLQSHLYAQITKPTLTPADAHELADSITSLAMVKEKLSSLSTWPQVRPVLKMVGLFSTSPLFGLALEMCVTLVADYFGLQITDHLVR
jgi:hypothetical protein